MSPLLCATVAASSVAELRAARDRAAAEADLVELRLDALDRPDVEGALQGRTGPVVVTCRAAWEGGGYRGSEEERRRLLEDALRLGAEYIDVEWRAQMADLVRARQGRGIVLSLHDFDGCPPDLAARVEAMRATGAEVVKVAVRTARLADLVPLLELGRAARRPHALVVIGMGPAGVVTRLLAGRFGSAWSYAGAAAPGQVPAGRMIEEFRFSEISDATAIYGIVGRPVAHSLSPAMHNAAFRAAGIDAVYVPFEAADADDFLVLARALDVRGASVTAPFKRAFVDRVDAADPIASQVGAVNTLRRVAAGWEATNTDVAGFLAPLVSRQSLAGARAAVIGAGGAARAVVVGLAHAGANVTVYARRLEQARETAALTGAGAAVMPPPPGSWDVLVNTTPVGTHPNVDESPLEALSFRVGAPGLPDEARQRRATSGARSLVYDLVYNPVRTRLLADADAAGLRTLGGLEMLVAQAQRQFEWWTGTRVPTAVMRDAASRRLAGLATDVDAPLVAPGFSRGRGQD